MSNPTEEFLNIVLFFIVISCVIFTGVRVTFNLAGKSDAHRRLQITCASENIIFDEDNFHGACRDGRQFYYERNTCEWKQLPTK